MEVIVNKRPITSRSRTPPDLRGPARKYNPAHAQEPDSDKQFSISRESSDSEQGANISNFHT